MTNNSTFAIAFKYHVLGRTIVPSGGGDSGKKSLISWKRYQTKRPTDSEIQVWEEQLRPKNWAMLTGPVSGVFVIDCDREDAIRLMSESGLKPHVTTPKGQHFYVRYPENWKVQNKINLLSGVDIRGEGGYVNFCGKNGKATYEVQIWPIDDELYTFGQLPKVLQNALKTKSKTPNAATDKTATDRALQKALSRAQPGNRNETGFWLACQLRDDGLTQAQAEEVMRRYAAWVTNIGSERYDESEALASLQQAYMRPARETWHGSTPSLPEIITSSRHYRDITKDALEALYKANVPERIFWRHGKPVQIDLDEKQKPYICVLDTSRLKGHMERSANYIHVKRNKAGEVVRTPTPPQKHVVEDILGLNRWNFPPLDGVVECPVMRKDGTVLAKPGYDRESKLHYHSSPDLTLPPIPDNPTGPDVAKAVNLILEPLGDFPFDSEESKANTIAAMFVPIIRPMINGAVPLTLFDKPQQGTGASLLCELIMLIAAGKTAAMMPAPKDEESWRKVITSALIAGQTVVTIDNIEHELRAPSLSIALTAGTYQDRILGKSEMVQLSCRTVWFATGNNIRLMGDLSRRCVWVRMDAQMARPWQRDPGSFKYPQLIQWVGQNRGNILAAILTVARGWVTAGMPRAERLPFLGGYEAYRRVIGGILAYMGVKGFLGNLDAMYDQTDTETPQWQEFLAAWYELFGEALITVAKVIKCLNENEALADALPDNLASREGKGYTHKFGKALSKRDNVRYANGLMVRKGGVQKRRAMEWQVVNFGEFEDANSHFSDTKCEFGEFTSHSPAREIKRKIVGKAYREVSETNSPNSHLDTNSGEQTHQTHQICRWEQFFDKNPALKSDSKPADQCPACGGGDYWLTSWGKWLCRRCHPETAEG